MIDLFEIGVSMSMTNGISGILGVITKDLLGVQHEIDKTGGMFSKMNLAIGGMAAVLGGAGILGAMWKLGDAGREQIEIEERLLTAGMKRNEIAQLTAKAWDLSLTKGDQTSTDYLEMMAEMRNALPDTAEVLKIAPLAADFMTDMRMGDPHSDPKGMLQDAIKAIAVRGRLYKPGTRDLDTDGIVSELDWMGRATRFTNGQQNAHTFRQMASQAGPIARGMTPEAFYGFGAEVGNTLNASKTGTALSSLFQQFMGGTMTEKVFDALASSNIIHEEHTHRLNGKKGPHILDAGALDDEAGFSGNPFTWLNKQINKYAADHDISTSIAAVRILGRATTQRLGSDATANIGELENSFDKQKQAYGIKDTSDEARKNSPDSIMRQLSSGWTDLMTALGKSLWLPGGPFPTTVHSIIDTLHSMTAWALRPENAATIAGILRWTAAIGAFLVVGGGLTIAAVAFAAMAPVLIPLGIGAGIAYAAFKLLGTTGFKAIGDNVIAFVGRVGEFRAKLDPTIHAVANIFTEFLTDVGNFRRSLDPAIHAIVDTLMSFLNAIAGFAGKLGDTIKSIGGGILSGAEGAAHGVGNAASAGWHYLFPEGKPGDTPPPSPFSAVPPPSNGNIIDNHIKLEVDKRVLAEVINRVNSSAASRPDSGPTGFNFRTSMPVPVGAN